MGEGSSPQLPLHLYLERSGKIKPLKYTFPSPRSGIRQLIRLCLVETQMTNSSRSCRGQPRKRSFFDQVGNIIYCPNRYTLPDARKRVNENTRLGQKRHTERNRLSDQRGNDTGSNRNSIRDGEDESMVYRSVRSGTYGEYTALNNQNSIRDQKTIAQNRHTERNRSF